MPPASRLAAGRNPSAAVFCCGGNYPAQATCRRNEDECQVNARWSAAELHAAALLPLLGLLALLRMTQALPGAADGAGPGGCQRAPGALISVTKVAFAATISRNAAARPKISPTM